MFKLYFGTSKETMTLVDEFATEAEVWIRIQNLLDKSNFKSYYMRKWLSDEEKNIYTVDYGSHNFFFFIQYPKS